MTNKIAIGDKEITVKMSAATPRLYRMKFQSDIITGMYGMFGRLGKEGGDFNMDEIEMLENLCYICHKQADPDQPDDVMEWLSQFGNEDIYNAFGDIIDAWVENNKTLSEAKKKKEGQQGH